MPYYYPPVFGLYRDSQGMHSASWQVVRRGQVVYSGSCFCRTRARALWTARFQFLHYARRYRGAI